ncbi:type II toxin-antitoxin system HicB family antitoxin [Ornithobacterium rhinotracheale]
MKTLKHKGFVGSIEIDIDSNSLYGKILGLDKKTLITYEGETIKELKADFEDAVNSYLELCKEKNIVPQKSYSGSFNVRIPIEIHAKIALKAQELGISLNAFVKDSLQKAVQ